MESAKRLYMGLPLGLVSAAVVVYEIGLTRLFSFLLHYHFTFLVVSGAVCGLGLGAMLAAALANRLPMTPQLAPRHLAVTALILALCLWGSVGLIVAWPRLAAPALLMAAGLPFVAAGAFIALLFQARWQESQRLYFYDLAGAALGIIWAVPALKWLGGIQVLLSAALAASLAGAWLGGLDRSRRWRLGLLGLAAISALAFAFQVYRPLLRLDLDTLAAAADKPMFRGLAATQNPGRLLQTRWSAYARTDLVDRTGDTGLNLYMDGGAGSYMFRFDGDSRRVAFVRREAAFFPYYFGPRRRALILGPGGGADVLYALMTGWERIEAVEINPEIVELVREYGDYNGHIYARDNVEVHRSDGRNYAARADGPYDLIALPLVYAEAADLVGFQLLENYLFTREAFAIYMDKLQDGGRLALVVHNHALMLRAVATLTSLWEQRYGVGPSAALDHLVVLNGRRAPEGSNQAYRPLVLIQKTPYTAAQTVQIHAAAAELGLRSHFVPGRVESGDLARLRHTALDSWAAALPQAVEPVSDERPFFYRTQRGIDGGILALLWGAGVAVVLLVLLPARLFAQQVGSTVAVSTAFFAAGLGAAYMLIEVFLLQRFSLFLGYPSLSLAVTLFALLFSSAVGSALGQGRPLLRTYGGVALWAAASAVAALGFGVAQAWILPLAMAWPIQARVLLSLVLIAPLGACMGVCYPALLRLAGAKQGRWVAWIWGVNGAASVLGSVAAVALAVGLGTSWGLWAGAGVYAVAALGLWRGAKGVEPLEMAPSASVRGLLVFLLVAAGVWYGVFTWMGQDLWGEVGQDLRYPAPAVHRQLWPEAIDPGF
jgi:hypothetical protein